MYPGNKCDQCIDSNDDTCLRSVSKGEEASAEPCVSHAVCVKKKKNLCACMQTCLCVPKTFLKGSTSCLYKGKLGVHRKEWAIVLLFIAYH